MYLAPSKHIIMNKFKFYFILFSTLLVLFSCNNDDDEVTTTPLRDFDEQYATDIANIEKYLQTHYLNLENVTDIASVVNSADLIKPLPTTGTIPPSIYSLLNSTTLPRLLYKEVTKTSHEMNTPYKVYYLQFREGNSTEKPCPLDEVLVTYRGTSLASGTGGTVSETEFDSSSIGIKFTLSATVSGWGEIIPLFGKGIFDETATGNGPNVYNNYGAGIMFLPSGLGYYNGSNTNIPSYSPLVFSFQLQNLKHVDNDSDGILTADEIVRNTDGSFTYTDTDGDTYADYIDRDDDNDGYPTLNETKYYLPIGIDPLQIVHYYPYNGALVDDPDTLIDETKGIPNCSNDFTTPTRTRKHLDKNCH